MELHPIVDSLSDLRSDIWCVLSPSGEGPSARVGHTCLFLGGKSVGDLQGNGKGRVLIIGGANPDGAFNDVYNIDITTLKWSKSESLELLARYEHSSFIPASCPDKVVVFGGASKTENLNDVQELNTVQSSWSNVKVSGTPPSKRTCHLMACVGDKLFVFGGGYKGADPVQDQEMYVFDAKTRAWNQMEAKGDKPSSRHGHLMVAIGTHIFLHGGMAGTIVYDDLYKFTTNDSTWHKLSPSGDLPDARTAHAGVAISNDVYIFGGMSGIGTALDDFYKLNTETLNWTKIKLDTLPPDPRLDHAMCTLTITHQLDEKPSTDSDDRKTTSQVIFLFGGMDTSGVIHNDCFVFRPEE